MNNEPVNGTAIQIPKRCCAAVSIKQRCGNAAAYRPIILAWARGYDKRTTPPIRMEPAMGFCSQHRFRLKLSDLGEMKAEVNKAVKEAGKAPVDWDSAELHMTAIFKV